MKTILLVLAVNLVFAVAMHAGTPELESKAIASDCKVRLKLITPQPVAVNMALLIGCRGFTAAEVSQAKKEFGPHANAYLSIYMNDAAAQAQRDKTRTCRVGSVIVKQKIFNTHEAINGVGGMIKRAPGYDSEHGDWEYFYFEDLAKIESDKIASCVNGHEGAKDRDHVFKRWAEAK